MAALTPDDPACSEARATLQAQQEARRAAIMEQQPIGKRLDSAQGALLRAQRRLNQALEAQDLANKAVATAQQAVRKLEADVAEIQASASGSEHRPVLTVLRENLRDAVAQLAQIDALPEEAAADAEAQSAALLSRFQATVEAASRNAAQVPRRHVGKTPPAPGVETSAPGQSVGHRYSTKGPYRQHQSKLENYFAPKAPLPRASSAGAAPGSTPGAAPKPAAVRGRSAHSVLKAHLKDVTG